MAERDNHVLLAIGRFLLVYGSAVAVGVLAGIISASGRLDVMAIFTGLIVGAAVVSSRKSLLWFVIICGLVVTGLAQLYLPGARYIRYLVPLVSIGLIFHGTMNRISNPALSDHDNISAIVLWALAFIIVAIVSTAVNWNGPSVPIMGLKGYFQMWGFFFGLLLVRWKPDVFRSLPRTILYIAFLQLPFVLHQYKFLVPKRIGLGGGIVPVDVVAGTFGASLLGGGSNSVLAAFMMVVIACLLGLWKSGSLSKGKALGMALLFLIPEFLNETKISALYLPLIYVILFYQDIVKKPLRFLISGVALSVLLAALLTVLAITQPSGKLHSISDLIQFTVSRQAASIDERSGGYNELTRWTSLTYWANEHVRSNPVNILIGHGPGASRISENSLVPVNSLAETRYGGVDIGYTAVSSLLWDTGILGLISILGMFFAAFRTAGWLYDYYKDRDPLQAGLFDGLRAGIAVLTLSLAHKDYFINNIPYQTLIMLIFGYLLVYRIQFSKPTC